MRIRSGAAGFCVTVAMAAMVTAGVSWIAVLLGWSVSTMVMLLLPLRRYDTGRGPAAGTLILGVLGITAAALGAESAFPEDGTFPFVSAMLLLILWRALCGQRQGMHGAANVLGMILLPVLGAVLLFGLKDVQWDQVTRPPSSWFQVYAALAAACPWWCMDMEGRNGRTWFWYGASAAVSLGLSLLTHGILGGALAASEGFPLYRAVQTVRIFGMAQRLEALVAAVLLMGAFGILLLLGEIVRDAAECLPGASRRWKSAGILLAAFLLEWVFRAFSDQASQVAETVFWGMVPFFVLWIVFLTKSEKND